MPRERLSKASLTARTAVDRATIEGGC